jgi:predicted secreted protein with PEFG-CTERM motif
MVSSSLAYSHPAYAHTFGADESASFLAKVQGIKSEMQAIQKDLSDKNLVSWHVDKLGEYWNANDTKEMGERNSLLANEIPNTINDITTAATASNLNPSNISQKITQLNGYLDEAIPVRIEKSKVQNATVNALALAIMVRETLEDYGDAIGYTGDMNSMKGMNMSGTTMPSSNMPVPIVNVAAYHSAQTLAKNAQNYLNNNVNTWSPSATADAINKVNSNFDKFSNAISGNVSQSAIMPVAHRELYPSLVDAFSITPIPEFGSLAVMIISISIIGVIIVSRTRFHV